MLIRSKEPDLLEVWDGGSGAVCQVSLAAFGTVSGLRWCAGTGEIVATASLVGGAVPDARADQRGDLRLFRRVPGEGQWERVWSKYAHDPICVSGGYAVHRGAGVTLLDHSGVVLREVKVGRFNWGPPALSVNDAGDRIAWARWVGDDMKPRVENLVDGTSFQARGAVYGYGWWDDRTLVYYLGNGLRLLDLTTGTSRAVPWDLRKIIREQAEGVPPEFVALASAPKDETWDNVETLRVDAASLWFTAWLSTRTLQPTTGDDAYRADGLFRLDRATGAVRLHAYVFDWERIQGVAVLPDGSAALRVTTYNERLAILRLEHRRRDS